MRERVRCTISAVSEGGAYAAGDGAEVVYLDRHELAWDPAATCGVSVGVVVEVMIIGRGPGVVFGSTKRGPSQDPWRDPERYQPGDLVFGVALGAGLPGVYARLPGGAVASIGGAHDPPLPGESVRLVLVRVTPAARLIEATRPP